MEAADKNAGMAELGRGKPDTKRRKTIVGNTWVRTLQ
jgi:hypothetical protein